VTSVRKSSTLNDLMGSKQLIIAFVKETKKSLNFLFEYARYIIDCYATNMQVKLIDSDIYIINRKNEI